MIKCNNCNNEKFITEPKGNSLGLYCSKCGKWAKWIQKSELIELQRVNKIVDRTSIEVDNKYYNSKQYSDKFNARLNDKHEEIQNQINNFNSNNDWVLGKVKKYIEDNLYKDDLNKSYHDYEINTRLDDCFTGGYEKGVAVALYMIGKIIGM